MGVRGRTGPIRDPTDEGEGNGVEAQSSMIDFLRPPGFSSQARGFAGTHLMRWRVSGVGRRREAGEHVFFHLSFILLQPFLFLRR